MIFAAEVLKRVEYNSRNLLYGSFRNAVQMQVTNYKRWAVHPSFSANHKTSTCNNFLASFVFYLGAKILATNVYRDKTEAR